MVAFRDEVVSVPGRYIIQAGGHLLDTHIVVTLDRVRVVFDDDHLVADAGLILPATLAQRYYGGLLTLGLRS